ncbi:hypothetical protein NMG60_11020545 [Bertholletia excelsa]
MEPPLPAPPVSATATAGNLAYPDSVDSSPRSRNADSWDDPTLLAGPVSGTGKLRLMCSYGGHIIPRPHDKSLCYAGGDTRIVVADRHSTLSDLTQRLSKTLLKGRSFTLKYQLPNEDLDSLISVTTDEDLENMVEEYDRIATNNSGPKTSRLRLFLFPAKPDSGSSIGSLLENSTKSEDWFLNALNGASRGFSESASVNSLLGLDDDVSIPSNADPSVKDVDVKGGSGGNKQGVQDVHSMPDSPMLETSSSFGSTSSSPSPLANLPPIRVHVEDQKAPMGGVEEQFSQMSVGAVTQKQDDGGFLATSSPPTMLTTVPVSGLAGAGAVGMPGILLGSAGEFLNRVFSDDERSEQGVPVGYRKPPQTQPQPPPLQPVLQQSQSKTTSGFGLASPDSVSSDGSTSNPLARQGPVIYQDQIVQNSSGNNRVSVQPVDQKPCDPNSRVQMQQVQDPGHVLPMPTQFDQHQQLNTQQQQPQQQQQFIMPTQFDQHQQLNTQQQQPQQQQQFIQAGAHYLHHHTPGAVPVTAYYPIYPSHQQSPHDQQFPVYYVPARQAQAYNLPVQQSNYTETATIPSGRPQMPHPSAMIHPSAAYNTPRSASATKPEMVYRTGAMSAQPLVPVSSSQSPTQYVAFSQIHHSSQSVAPTTAPTANYAYEYTDPARAQIYYTQQPLAMAPHMAGQYQNMAASPAVVLPESAAQVSAENMKQQIRTSQP